MEINMHWHDPNYLPLTAGKLERFTMNPDGAIDGFVLNDGILVHVPPHLSDQVRAAVNQGDEVRVRGVKPRGAAFIAAVSIEGADGRVIVDDGPDAYPEGKADNTKNIRRSPMDISGKVRLTLFAPKGQVRGALLADGTILHLGHKEAERLAERLRPGVQIAARGEGLETDLGRMIEVSEIGGADGTFNPIKKPKHRHPEKSEANAIRAIA
jgi:hypothetical protein